MLLATTVRYFLHEMSCIINEHHLRHTLEFWKLEISSVVEKEIEILVQRSNVSDFLLSFVTKTRNSVPFVQRQRSPIFYLVSFDITL